MISNKHVIKQKRVLQKDKCRFGFGVRNFIILEYERHMCHQEKFLKGTQDFVYKDGCEPARNPRQELGLMTKTSTQRHMYKDVNKDATMQAKQRKIQTRWHKTSIASIKEAKHVITQRERVNIL